MNEDEIIKELDAVMTSIQGALESYVLLMDKIEIHIHSEDYPKVINKLFLHNELKKMFMTIGYRFDSSISHVQGDFNVEIDKMNEMLLSLYTRLKMGKKG